MREGIGDMFLILLYNSSPSYHVEDELKYQGKIRGIETCWVYPLLKRSDTGFNEDGDSIKQSALCDQCCGKASKREISYKAKSKHVIST